MTELKELNEAELDRNLRAYHADDKCYVSRSRSLLTRKGLAESRHQAPSLPAAAAADSSLSRACMQCYCGNTLVAINPFKIIPGLYDNPVSE